MTNPANGLGNAADYLSKIKVVSEQLERMYCLLQLQGCYDSNEFSRELIGVMQRIRDLSAGEIPNVFNESMLAIIKEKKGVESLETIWNYVYFKNAGLETLNKPFIRYALARVEGFVSTGANVTIRHPIKDLAVGKWSKVFHVEHILAHNDENRAKFESDEMFEQQRNRLGGLLLLKGPDNQSSGKEPYREKLRTYASSLLWNETLIGATYQSNLDLRNWIAANGFDMRSMSEFGKEEIESRHKLLFAMFAKIWNV